MTFQAGTQDCTTKKSSLHYSPVTPLPKGATTKGVDLPKGATTKGVDNFDFPVIQFAIFLEVDMVRILAGAGLHTEASGEI